MKCDLQDVCDRLDYLKRSLEHRNKGKEFIMTQKDIDILKKKNEILEKRCERYREIIRNEVSMFKLNDYFDSGVMTVNDIRYLCELTELSESETKHLIKPKPPLGVMPRDIWDRDRKVELSEAMKRYLEAGMKIPSKWLEEYNEISERWEEKER